MTHFNGVQPVLLGKAQVSTTEILIVEDESAVRELLTATLSGGGYEVLEAASVAEAQGVVANHKPALILLDWMLPGVSGLEFAKWLRRDPNFSETPVIMLTARDEENYKVQGLEAGIDDYVTKPFSTRELLARIKAVLRRAGGSDNELIRIDGCLEMDLSQHRVLANEQSIPIGPTEFKLLHFFPDPSGACLFPCSASGPGLGKRCVHRRTHGGRAHPPSAQGAGTARSGKPGADSAWCGLPLLGQADLNPR